MRNQANARKHESTKWTAQDWERAWQSALRRINGMPAELQSCPQIRQSLTAMDDAFSCGDSTEFESALIVLLDSCAELVNRGEYLQWW